MPQPDVLTASLGMLQITATMTGYKIVSADGTVVDQKDETVHESKTEGTFVTPKTHCAATNMQRAMLRAQQIMEEQEREAIKSRIAVGDASDFDGDGETARGMMYEGEL